MTKHGDFRVSNVNVEPRSVNLTASLDAVSEVVPKPECQVMEFDERTGDKKWKDALYVQEFTDSVLDTRPAELE